jgi:uncharacterized protein
MHVLEVRNAELIRSLTEQAAAHGITDAAIVALIGAVDGFTVSTTPAEDPTSHNISQYPLPAEMTATGEFIGGKPHIHAVMAVAGHSFTDWVRPHDMYGKGGMVEANARYHPAGEAGR